MKARVSNLGPSSPRCSSNKLAQRKSRGPHACLSVTLQCGKSPIGYTPIGGLRASTSNLDRSPGCGARSSAYARVHFFMGPDQRLSACLTNGRSRFHWHQGFSRTRILPKKVQRIELYGRVSAYFARQRFQLMQSLPDTRAALVSAHPGHELRVHGWLEIARPLVFVL